jgi:diguanylate cyclase
MLNLEQLRGVTVLFIDDHDDFREETAAFLEHVGATVVHASSGPQALDILADRTVDVIVSDLWMPHMTGLDFLKRVRRLPGQAERPTPAIAHTALPDEAAASAEAGFTRYLVKPLDPRTLVAAIVEVLRRP